MRLAVQLDKIFTCDKIVELLEKDVTVSVYPKSGTDGVSVEGFEGEVTTDVLAQLVFNKMIFLDQLPSGGENDSKLVSLLEKKVFSPLEERIDQLDRISCCYTTLYKLRNSSRLGWTSLNSNLLEGKPWLKHRSLLKLLSKSV